MKYTLAEHDSSKYNFTLLYNDLWSNENGIHRYAGCSLLTSEAVASTDLLPATSVFETVARRHHR